MITRNLALVSLLVAGVATAQAPDGIPVDAPPPPPPLRSGEALEPEVTIIQQDDRTVYEYRVNGQTYMVKIVPTQGPPYYLIDQDGDGQLESRRFGPEELQVPMWVLFRW
jgi:hypothetical protein